MKIRVASSKNMVGPAFVPHIWRLLEEEGGGRRREG